MGLNLLLWAIHVLQGMDFQGAIHSDKPGIIQQGINDNFSGQYFLLYNYIKNRIPLITSEPKLTFVNQILFDLK